MHHKLIAAAAATSIALGLGATAAAAAPPSSDRVPAGIQCQQKGISTLLSLGALDDVARDGVVVVASGATVSFSDVLELHREMPELFTSAVPVALQIPGVGLVPNADWCDGIDID